MPKGTHVEREKAIRILQANVTPSVIAKQFRCHARMSERLIKRFCKLEQCQTVHIHEVSA